MYSAFLYLISPKNLFGLNLEYLIFSFFLFVQIHRLNFIRLKYVTWISLWISNTILLTLINYSNIVDFIEILKELARGLLIFILLNSLRNRINVKRFNLPYFLLIFNLIISILQFYDISSISELYSQDELYGRASGVFKYLHSNILFYTLFLLILPIGYLASLGILIGNALTLSKLALINLFFLKYNFRLIVAFLSSILIFLIILAYVGDNKLMAQANALFNFFESSSFIERRSQLSSYNLIEYIIPKDSPGTLGLNSHRVEITAFNLLLMHGLLGVWLYYYALYELLKENKYFFIMISILTLIGSPIDEPKAIVCIYFLMFYYHAKNK
jgi:hypothetical protein